MDRDLVCEVEVLHTDQEIWERIDAAAPAVVSIDAPLSLPRGRRSLGDRSGPHFRSCDLALRTRGIRFFPLTLGPMRMLTRRGMRLRTRLERAGFVARESYPGAAQDILGIPRKGAGLPRLRAGLLRLGVQGGARRRGLTHDELDAITAAYVGRLWLEGQAEEIGDPREGVMILPRPRSGASAPTRQVSGRDVA